MVTAKELRVGNIVQFGILETINMVVETIHKDGINEDISEDQDYPDADSFRQVWKFEEIDPIRITEDVLSKISAYSRGKINKMFVQNQIKDGHMVFLINDSWESVEFVHQLQNLYFALAKEELDIIL